MWGSGSACWFGPQFWMIHDIILVTLNYRWVGVGVGVGVGVRVGVRVRVRVRVGVGVGVRVGVSSTTLFTLHLRLGPLGFLSLGTSEVPGNAGMLDQVAALSWVQVGHCWAEQRTTVPRASNGSLQRFQNYVERPPY